MYAQLTITWIGQVLGSIGTKRPETGTAYHAILIALKSSNSLRWLNILIKIGTNLFWWAPRLSIMFNYFLNHISWKDTLLLMGFRDDVMNVVRGFRG